MSKEIARALRKSLTPPEVRLWVCLKGLRGQGYHFRRQAEFRGYYLDFVCFSRRLVVEVDGVHHDFPDQMRHDRIRDAVLSKEGFRTLRFRNEDIRDGIEIVMDTIIGALVAAVPTRPSGPPSP